MIGRALLALVLAAPAAFAQKVGELPMTVQQFGGENTFIDSARLPPNSAQSAVNVLTEHGYLEKRPGSTLAGSCPGSIENMTEFVKSGGARMLLCHAGSNVNKTDFGSTAVAIATVTSNANVDFAIGFNKAVIVDGTNEIEYDGNSTTTTSGYPGCKYIEFALNRFWCANITAESTSRVRVSSFGSVGYFTVPLNVNLIPDAPNYFEIQRDDGQAILCLKNTPWGVVVGKRRSLWIIKGYDNTNWYVRNIDPAIGCVDDRSMQIVDGRLQFLAVDGVYSWTGSGALKLESQEVESVVRSGRQSSTQLQSWALDSQSDFASGLVDQAGPGAKTSYTISPGDVVPSSWTTLDTSSTNFAAGTIPAGLTTATVTGSLMLSSSPFIITNGDFEKGTLTGWTCGNGIANPDDPCRITTQHCHGGTYCAQLQTNCGAQGSGSQITIRASVQNSAGVTVVPEVVLSTGFNALDLTAVQTSTLQVELLMPSIFSIQDYAYLISSTFTGLGQLQLWVGSDLAGPDACVVSTYTTANFDDVKVGRFFAMTAASATPVAFQSAVFDTALSTPVAGPIAISSGTGLSTTTIDSSVGLAFQVRWASSATGAWSAWNNVTNGDFGKFNKEFVQYQSTFTTNCGTCSPRIDSVSLQAATTGQYRSPVDFVGIDISGWGSFDVNQTLPLGSSLTYRVRQATYSFPAGDNTIAWSAQQPNATIGLSVTTPTYVQWDALFNFPSSTATPTISLGRVNWQTGSPTAAAASAFLNHRYFLCIAVSSSINDTCLVQQRTRDWVTFTGQNIGAYTLYNSDLLGGDATSSGKVWREMQDGVYNDDGQAIDASWISPDYMFGDPVSQKVLTELWVDAMPSTSTLLSVGYAVDRTSTSYVTKTMDLGAVTSMVNQKLPINNGFVLGKYIRFKFANAELNRYFRVNAFTLFGQNKPKTE